MEVTAPLIAVRRAAGALAFLTVLHMAEYGSLRLTSALFLGEKWRQFKNNYSIDFSSRHQPLSVVVNKVDSFALLDGEGGKDAAVLIFGDEAVAEVA